MLAAPTPHNLKRPEPQALASTLEALAARFGNRLVTSQAVRDQHAHTTTWLAPQAPDAVVMAQEPADIQDVVRICAKHKVPGMRGISIAAVPHGMDAACSTAATLNPPFSPPSSPR